jgi:hypothetical protein
MLTVATVLKKFVVHLLPGPTDRLSEDGIVKPFIPFERNRRLHGYLMHGSLWQGMPSDNDIVAAPELFLGGGALIEKLLKSHPLTGIPTHLAIL